MTTENQDTQNTEGIPEDGVFGDLTPEERMMYQQHQARVTHNVNQLGLLEIRKGSLVGEYHQAVGQLESFMRNVAKRLGVPPDHRFKFRGATVISAVPSEQEGTPQ